MRAASASPRTRWRRTRWPPFLLCCLLFWLSLLLIHSHAFTLDELPEGVLEEDDEPKGEAMEPSTRAGAVDDSKSLAVPAKKAVMKLPRLPAALSVQWSSVQRRANHMVLPSLIAVAVGGLVSLTAMAVRKLPALWSIIRRPEASASVSTPPRPRLFAWGLGLTWPGFLQRRSRESGLYENEASTGLDLSGQERSSKSKARADKDSQVQKLQAALRAKEEVVEAHRARGEELAGSRRTIETLKRDVDILMSEKEEVTRRMESLRRDHERQLEKVTSELRMARTSLERKKGDKKGARAGDDTSLEAEKRLSEQYQRMLEAERQIMADEAKSRVAREQAALEAEKARLQTIFEEEKARLQALFHQRLEEEVDVIRVRYEDELRSQLEAWKERCTDAVKANQEETQRRMMEYVQAREEKKAQKEQQ